MMEKPGFSIEVNKEKDVESRKYEAWDASVEVSWKEFSPAKESISPDKATIFLPGFGMDAGSKSLKELTQSFADYSGERAYSVSTKIEKVTEDSLHKEAEAIRQFVKETGIKRITLAGYSEGGIKAVNLVVLLQEKNPDIDINGLILLDSAGLYEQEKGKIIGDFAKDALVDTLPAVIKQISKRPELWKKAFQAGGAGLDVLFGIFKEIGKFKLHYPERLLSQVGEIVKANPRLKSIKAPIILVQGSEDPISVRERIVPKAEEAKIVEAYLQEAELEGSIQPYIDSREEFLKQNLFSESPYIRAIEAEKFGHHSLPLLRSESVAKVSLYLLERWHRKQN